MGQNPVQPFIDARDKLIDWAQKIEDWDKPATKKAPATAKQLHWADQSGMRKPVGKKAARSQAPAVKAAPKKRAARKRAQ